jgi:hypothetical protein
MSDDLVKKLREIHKFPALANEVCDEAANRIEAQEKLIQEMREALEAFVAEYTEMVNSGDCGFWDPEKEDKVIAARTALSKAKSQQEGETE